MRVLSVVGARPQFVKLATVAEQLDVGGHEHIIVHTGQHYDAQMSASFFQDLHIPAPTINLAVGSGAHGAQTAAMLAGIERELERIPTDWVLVYGDTNSTVAGALAASKMHRRVAHLEAGLRSFNRRMPEELNRVATDHLSDLLLAPTALAQKNLSNEALGDRTVVTGDVMTDICLRFARSDPSRPPMPPGIAATDPYVIATIHRPDNTDNPLRLNAVLRALEKIPVKVVLAAHPRLIRKAADFGLDLTAGSLNLRDPFTYPEMIAALQCAAGLVTDSGGLQKEAFLLGVPTTTLRSETEWPETLDGGWNILDDDLVLLPDVAVRECPDAPRGMPYGDGKAASRVVSSMKERLAAKPTEAHT